MIKYIITAENGAVQETYTGKELYCQILDKFKTEDSPVVPKTVNGKSMSFNSSLAVKFFNLTFFKSAVLESRKINSSLELGLVSSTSSDIFLFAMFVFTPSHLVQVLY